MDLYSYDVTHMTITMHHPAKPEHVAQILNVMNPTDRTELSALSNGKPALVLEAVLKKSAYSFVGLLDDGTPVALGGFVDGAPGNCWMVGSSELLYRNKKSFLKHSKEETARMLALCPYLITTVDNRWRKSLKWLTWIGFLRIDEVEVLHRSATVLAIKSENLCLN